MIPPHFPDFLMMKNRNTVVMSTSSTAEKGLYRSQLIRQISLEIFISSLLRFPLFWFILIFSTEKRRIARLHT